MEKEALETFRKNIKTRFLLDCISNQDWKINIMKKNISVSSKLSPSKTRVIKTISIVKNVKVQLVFNYMIDERCMKEWNPECIEVTPKYRIYDVGKIYYFSSKYPFPFSKRDAVMMRFWDCKPDNFCIYETSIYHEKIPERANYVRANMKTLGFKAQQNGDDVIITSIGELDSRGKIPGFLQNISTVRACYHFVNGLLIYIDKHSLTTIYRKKTEYMTNNEILGNIPQADNADLRYFTMEPIVMISSNPKMEKKVSRIHSMVSNNQIQENNLNAVPKLH